MSGTQFVLALSAVLLFSFFVGAVLNRRRGADLAKQVWESVKGFGDTATIRWFGRSGFRIEVEKANSPFTRLAVSILLEPREALPVWAFGRLRGRRDLLVVSTGLAGPVGVALDIYDPNGAGGKQLGREIRARGWEEEPVAGRPGLLCGSSTRRGRDLARDVIAAIGTLPVWRIGVREEDPHLIITMPAPPASSRTPLRIFTSLPDLARVVLRTGRSR